MFKWFKRDQSQEAAESAAIRAAVQPTKSTWFGRVGLLFQRSQIAEDLWDELEEALISADVGPETGQRLITTVREGVRAVPGATPETARALLKAEMVNILNKPRGEKAYEAVESVPGSFQINQGSPQPWVTLVVGVNGSGKTTTIAKLAAGLKERGQRVLLGAADTFRAAAVEQLQSWGERIGVDVVAHQAGSDPGAVAFDALQAAKARGADVVLIDTAGRLHTKSNLMEELKKVRRVVQRFDEGAPHEVLLILDATTGQNGLVQARHFTEAVQVTGVVLTKLDGTAKGGVVLAVVSQLGVPVAYLGTGEGMQDLVPFEPEAFVDALLS